MPIETNTDIIDPNIILLDETLSACRKARLEQFQTSRAEETLFTNHVDPQKWVPLIEAALNTPQLEALRIKHEQICIIYLCSVLAAEAAQLRAVRTREQLLVTVKALLSKPNDALHSMALDRAMTVDFDPYDLEPTEYVSKMNNELRRTCCQVLERAFAKLMEQVSPVEVFSEYPENPVCPTHPGLIFWPEDDQTGSVFPVRFEGCDEDNSAKNRELLQRLNELQVSLEIAQNHARVISNEVYWERNNQHNDTMIRALHGETLISGPTPKVAIISQQKVLLKREAARQIALLTLSSLKAAHETVFGVLKEAVLETRKAAEQMKAENGRITDHEWRVLLIMMNNCLAADSRLRDFGPEFRRLSAICQWSLPTEHQMQGVWQLLKTLTS